MTSKLKGLAYQDLASQLREAIIKGRIPAGARLPSETALGAKYGVSRSTVREAIRSLSSQGLLETTRGAYGGSSVRRYGHTHATEALENVFAMLSTAREISMDEILQARLLFEIPASHLAALERTEEHLAQLRSLVLPVNTRQSIKYQSDMNTGFHNAILDATGNRLLRTMLRPLFDILPRRSARELADAEFWDRISADHRRILHAIELRDAEAAGSLMAQHLAQIQPTYERIDAKARRRD
jgi:DNA-binding FadR family transcriptional regulator